MNSRIFTSNYDDCKIGNLISISGDRGKSVGFTGRAFPQLAPKLNFWKVWHDNIGTIPEEENNRYYIKEYYCKVLKKVDFEELFKDEKDPILLCYEKGQSFCHRHIVAEYLELKYGITVNDIIVDRNLNITINERPKYIRNVLEELIRKDLDKFDERNI